MINEVLELKSSWEALADCREPIVLYGTGDGADKITNELERLGIGLYGVTASDGFVRERFFRGFRVMPVSHFEESLSSFTVILGFGTNRENVIENIKNISSRHRLLVPCVPVYGDEIINRAFLLRYRDELESVYSMLADERSRQVFADFLRFELSGELEYLFRSESVKSEAFTNILRLGSDERYLDLGAYRGDTVEELLYYTHGEYRSITAVEPDKKSFEKLECNTDGLQNCTLINAGIHSECGFLPFNKKRRGRGNSADAIGEMQEVVTVDSLASPDGFSYIKADVEGSEADMLYGAVNTLKSFKPKLNIACYHKSRDIFELPLKIKKINPDYGIYLRHHRYIPCWDLNLYCV